MWCVVSHGGAGRHIGSVRRDGARDWIALGECAVWVRDAVGCVWMDARLCGCVGRLRCAAVGADVGAE